MNKYFDFFGPGKYNCVVCNEPLFRSEDKFDNKNAFPTFHNTIGKLVEMRDDGNLEKRKQKDNILKVCCENCGAFLGHVKVHKKRLFKKQINFGRYYRINSAALKFEPPETSFQETLDIA